MSFVTYAILDPKTLKARYVGQTKDFDERRKAHLGVKRLKEKPDNRLRAWLWETMGVAKRTPKFLILEMVETEAESLASEQKWVERLAEAGFDLLNGWVEHRDALDSAQAKNHRRRMAILRKSGRR